MQILVSQGVDILACETLPGTKEALAIADLLREMPGMKAWITFTTKVCCYRNKQYNTLCCIAFDEPKHFPCTCKEQICLLAPDCLNYFPS